VAVSNLHVSSTLLRATGFMEQATRCGHFCGYFWANFEVSDTL